MKKATHEDSYEDDGIIFYASDFEHSKLKVRVGPVFNGDVPHPETGIWIEVGGEEFLMSQEAWVALNAHIHRRVDEWKRFKDILVKGDI